MEWKSAQHKEGRVWEIPERWLHIYYYEALTILFRFENSIRVFVYAVLKNQLFDKWTEAIVSSDSANQTTINSVSKKRIAQAQSFGYLGFEINAPIMHLTSGELVELMTSDAYWTHFKPFFRGNKEIIKNKLLEIGSIRNSLAHFRPIRHDDVAVLKQNTNHTMMEIEHCLEHLVSFPQIVPTNTGEAWYKKLAAIGSDQFTIELKQSGDSNWICITITYHIKTVRFYKVYEGYYSYNVLNLVSQSLLTESPSLQKYITHLSEYIPYVIMPENMSPNFNKKLSLVFSRKVIIDNFQSIASDIENIVLNVKSECELVEQDNLARGKFIFAMEIRALQREHERGKYWNINTLSLVAQSNPNDPPEYWGSLSNDSDFVAGNTRYPWMPTDIADEEFPF